LAGEALKSQVELLISIKGVAPLIVLAFPADVADVRGFRMLRKMNASLGLVTFGRSSRSVCTTLPPPRRTWNATTVSEGTSEEPAEPASP